MRQGIGQAGWEGQEQEGRERQPTDWAQAASTQFCKRFELGSIMIITMDEILIPASGRLPLSHSTSLTVSAR